MNAPLLQAKNLTMRFGGLVAVSKVNLEIRPGELVGLIGPNGAGKTTLFNMLSGVYRPTEGEILFEGQNLVGLSPDRVCKSGVARTFQNIRLFSEMTVLENILVALHRRRGYSFLSTFLRLPQVRTGEKRLREEARTLLASLGLEEKSQVLARNLPYGDRRRVEIARALATGPRLLLLDEPAAGMNPKETSELSQLILRIRDEHRLAVLLIEHDMSLVMRICERISVLDYGTLIAEGNPAMIKNDPRVIEAYLGGSLKEMHA